MTTLYHHGTGDILTERHDNGILQITTDVPAGGAVR